MAFTAKDVQALRERTGVGMMECKKALTEAEGDMDRAVDILRERGLAAATKKAGRIAAEGVVYAYVDEAAKVGVVLEVNSESDFVAKNEKFMDYVKVVAGVIAANDPADVAALAQMLTPGGVTVEKLLQEMIQVIGENMNIRRFERYEGDVVAYVHGGGRIGVLVKFEADEAASGTDALVEGGRDVAMQIAALNPLYLDKACVPAEDIEKEKGIRMIQIQSDPKMASKPEAIIAKMLEGHIAKFCKENCLMQQEFVKNGDLTVEQYVAEMAKKVGGAMRVVSFVRFEKGEGLQKREDNFAEEVASMVR